MVRSLATRLRVAFVVLAVVPFVAAAGGVWLMGDYLLHQSLFSLGNDQQILMREAARLAQRLEAAQARVRGLVQGSGLKDGDVAAAAPLLRGWVTETSGPAEIIDVFLLDRSQHVLASATRTPGGHRLPLEALIRSMDLARVREGHPARGEVCVAPVELPSVVVAEPVGSLGASGDAVVVARVSLGATLAEFREVFRKAEGTAYVLDEQGRVVWVSGVGNVAGVAQAPGGRVRGSMGDSIEIVDDQGGGGRMRAWASVGNTGWQLLWERSLVSLAVQKRHMLRVLLAIFLVSLALAVMAGFRFVRKIMGPVQRLTEASLHIAEGRYDERIPQDLSARATRLARLPTPSRRCASTCVAPCGRTPASTSGPGISWGAGWASSMRCTPCPRPSRAWWICRTCWTPWYPRRTRSSRRSSSISIACVRTGCWNSRPPGA